MSNNGCKSCLAQSDNNLRVLARLLNAMPSTRLFFKTSSGRSKASVSKMLQTLQFHSCNVSYAPFSNNIWPLPTWYNSHHVCNTSWTHYSNVPLPLCVTTASWWNSEKLPASLPTIKRLSRVIFRYSLSTTLSKKCCVKEFGLWNFYALNLSLNFITSLSRKNLELFYFAIFSFFVIHVSLHTFFCQNTRSFKRSWSLCGNQNRFFLIIEEFYFCCFNFIFT